MGGQTRTDILPYKFLIPVFGFFMSVTCTACLYRIWKLDLVPLLRGSKLVD